MQVALMRTLFLATASVLPSRYPLAVTALSLLFGIDVPIAKIVSYRD